MKEVNNTVSKEINSVNTKEVLEAPNGEQVTKNITAITNDSEKVTSENSDKIKKLSSLISDIYIFFEKVNTSYSLTNDVFEYKVNKVDFDNIKSMRKELHELSDYKSEVLNFDNALRKLDGIESICLYLSTKNDLRKMKDKMAIIDNTIASNDGKTITIISLFTAIMAILVNGSTGNLSGSIFFLLLSFILLIYLGIRVIDNVFNQDNISNKSKYITSIIIVALFMIFYFTFSSTS